VAEEVVVIGAKELITKLEKLPTEVGDEGVESAINYIIEYERLYPGSMKGAPFEWTSEKQRRAYFASNGFGHGIPYQRKFKIRWGWRKEGKGRTATAVNRVPYTKYVKLDQYQQIGFKRRNWRTVETDLRERESHIVAAFDKGVKKAIKRLGL